MVKKKAKPRKKKVVQPKEDKDVVYVKIDSALSLRKAILEGAIDITTLLKRWESYKVIRELKLQEIKKLKKLMNQIDKEFGRFVKDLPKADLYKKKKVVEDRVEEKVVVQKDTGLSEIDRELATIKDKLANLRV
jgi:NifB/MoaA-like Fe-S oxidoreductase